MEEWKDRSSRFEKSLKKTEEKLKEQISIGREVSIWVMCELSSEPCEIISETFLLFHVLKRH